MAAGSSSARSSSEVLPPARLRGLMLMILAGLALYLSGRMLQPFATVLLGAIALAILFSPMNERLLARGWRPNLAAFATLAVVVLMVLLPIGIAGLALAAELSDLLGDSSEAIGKMTAGPEGAPVGADFYAQARERFPWLERIRSEQLSAGLQALGEQLLKGSLGVLGKVAQAAIRFALVAFTLFFLLRDGPKLLASLRELLPLSRRQADALLDRTVELVRASTYGVVVVALVQGTLGGVMFAVLGVPSPMLWGVLMTLMSMIPMIGPGVVWFPVALFLLLSERVTAGLVLLGWGTLVVSVVDNVLRPKLIGDRSRLHELVVFFGVIGGLRLFGLIGILVGPTLLALTAALLALVRERNGTSPASVPGEPASGG
jgi:predicted PurR-regulated permease PerM